MVLLIVFDEMVFYPFNCIRHSKICFFIINIVFYEKPRATSLALYLVTSLFSFLFLINTHLYPTGLSPYDVSTSGVKALLFESLSCFFPQEPIFFLSTLLNRFWFRILILKYNIKSNILYGNIVTNYISSISFFSSHDIIYRNYLIIILSYFILLNILV